jgi:hypothetical protein
MRKLITTLVMVVTVALSSQAQNLAFKATTAIEYDHKGIDTVQIVQDSSRFLFDFGNSLFSEWSEGSRIILNFTLLERSPNFIKIKPTNTEGVEIHAFMVEGKIVKIMSYNRNRLKKEFSR